MKIVLLATLSLLLAGLTGCSSLSFIPGIHKLAWENEEKTQIAMYYGTGGGAAKLKGWWADDAGNWTEISTIGPADDGAGKVVFQISNWNGGSPERPLKFGATLWDGASPPEEKWFYWDPSTGWTK